MSYKEILKIAWPLITANSFWNIQLTIDRVFLGNYSTEALGAAMAVMGVFWVPMALLQQTAGYITTFVAQYFGANESHKIGSVMWQAFYISVIGGVGFLGLNFLSPAFFAFVGHPELTQKLEIEYFNSLAFSALPTALVAAVSGFFTGLGNTRVVIWINLVGLILNAVLDYVLIFGNWGFPAMGIQGAGYATALATYGSAIVGAYLIFTRDNQKRFKILSDWRWKTDLQKQFLKFGIPSGMQWALEGLAFTSFLILMGRYANGEAALASSSIAVTVMMLSVLPTMGVAQAVLALVGQAMGDKNPKRAEQATIAGIKISMLYISFVALSFYLIPEFYLSWFKNEDNAQLWEQVSILTPQLLRIVALFTIFDSVYLNISFALKGAGDTRFVSLMALLVPWPTMVLPTYLLSNHPNGVTLAWWSTAFYVVLIAGILFLRFRQGKWRTMSVIHPSN